jgi:phospholipase/carboxylesterase
MDVQLLDLGPLRARVIAPVGPVERAIVLLHGFGASGDDLVALAEWIDAGEGTAWVFPEAPLELGGLYGDSRAWWMIDLDSIGRLDRDRSEELPDGLVAARAQLIALLDAVRARFGDRIVLGGFSQGAMLSLDVALHDPRPLDGLILLSGTLLARSEWAPRMAARAGLPVVQSHGRRDQLLPFRAAVALRDLLAGAGLEVTWVEFDGGHEIPPPVLEAVTAAVRRRPGTR